MENIIKVYCSSSDEEKINIAKKWIQLTRIPHKDRVFSPIILPKGLVLKPNEISEFASAINTLLPDELVTDFNTNGCRVSFITTKKYALSWNKFNTPTSEYYMQQWEYGWCIINDVKR